MIYILEGADGTGKTTLANEIAETKKTSVLHSYFNRAWDIKQHHVDMWKAAKLVAKWRPVVLDRWAPSEFVYGNVFRKGPGYDVLGYLWEMEDELKAQNVVWIYCRNDNVVENHLKNIKFRNEMFGDMSSVIEEFDKFVKMKEHNIKFIEYDYDKVDMVQFVKDLPGENFTN